MKNYNMFLLDIYPSDKLICLKVEQKKTPT